MSAVERISAALDEAEKRLDAASIPWSVAGQDGTAVDQAGPGAYIARTNQQADTTLIVSVVNRERAQIRHARDVLARHTAEPLTSAWCEHDENNWPCPDVASLLAVWCPEPTP